MHYYFHYLLLSSFYCFLLLGFIGEILIFQTCIVLLRYLQNVPIFSLFIRSYYIPMTVSLVQWRAVIGAFNCQILVMFKNCENYLVNNFISLIETLLLLYHYFESAYKFLFTLLYLFVALQCHGDIELNSGPKNLKNKLLSVCHSKLMTTQNLHS